MNKINSKLLEEKSEPKIPTDFQKALMATPLARTLWMDITPIARRDWISWIEGAKQQETRRRRIEVACSKLVAGKRRPCCYAIVPVGLYKAIWAVPKAKAIWKSLTPTERRDFVDWVDGVKESEAHKLRIRKVCKILTSGKRHI